MAGTRDPQASRTLIAVVAGVMLFITATLALAVLDVPYAPLLAAVVAIVVSGVAVWRARSTGDGV